MSAYPQYFSTSWQSSSSILIFSPSRTFETKLNAVHISSAFLPCSHTLVCLRLLHHSLELMVSKPPSPLHPCRIPCPNLQSLRRVRRTERGESHRPSTYFNNQVGGVHWRPANPSLLVLCTRHLVGVREALARR